MERKQSAWLQICLCFLAVTALVACSGVSNDDSSDPGATPTPTPTPPGGDVGSIDESGFWVAAQAPYTTHTRNATGFNDYCMIPLGDEDQTISCIIDAPEAGLNVSGISLQYNAPNTMCQHIIQTTYWYFDGDIGKGPATFTVDKTYDAGDVFQTMTCDGGGGPVACNSTNFPELVFDISGEDIEITCAYKCCTGSYVITTNEDHTASGGAITTSDNSGDWGSTEYTDCIGGPGKNWGYTDENGYPTGVITAIPSGVNTTYDIAAPIAEELPTNTSIANYYDPAAHLHTGMVSASTSFAPYCVNPIDDIDGDPIEDADGNAVAGNPTYSFYCTDEEREVRNIIHVYIRDWDTKEEFDDYISSEGVSGDPDKDDLDEDGTNCEGLTGKCNDYWDLDDILNITNGGLYDTATPASRVNFFPNEIPD